MRGFNHRYKHRLDTIKLHGKMVQVLIPVYKEKQKNNEKSEIKIKDK